MVTQAGTAHCTHGGPVKSSGGKVERQEEEEEEEAFSYELFPTYF